MEYLPLFFDLRDRPTLMVGGDAVAARRIDLLLRAGAAVRVVAHAVTPEIEALARAGRVQLDRRAFATSDVAGCVAVFGSGADAGAADVATAARAANIPVNIVDRPDLSTFIMPAIVDRDPVVVAISSGGAAPVLARRVRAQIEALLPARLGALARFARRFRAGARGVLPSTTLRRRFWERTFESPVADAVLAGNEAAAQAQMVRLLNQTVRSETGVVYLVGAGPGDPDLLTVRALHLMQQAELVLYDELIGAEILDRVRRDADRVYVGKSKGRHSLSQDEINALMLREARAGRRVLRLKGGDPFVFGRGGEEMEYLRRHGIEVIAVPGITAAVGALAAAGIPLTHRDHASAVTFVTGHTRSGDAEIDWGSLARGDRTLVIYMGLSHANEIADRLRVAGLDAHTPVAVVQNGTRSDQRVSTGTLAELGALAAAHAGQGPALLVIGDVAAYAHNQGAQDERAVSWRK
ncbi:MAG: uroporphyrinogen-III C-methyltransferase [Alphaproteobacteria bacterium]|nr:uroporphyrinogen-III C-methyltransferase [Alphaproteobacteria bacterium]